jgi:hypothetical protein
MPTTVTRLRSSILRVQSRSPYPSLGTMIPSYGVPCRIAPVQSPKGPLLVFSCTYTSRLIMPLGCVLPHSAASLRFDCFCSWQQSTCKPAKPNHTRVTQRTRCLRWPIGKAGVVTRKGGGEMNDSDCRRRRRRCRRINNRQARKRCFRRVRRLCRRD